MLMLRMVGASIRLLSGTPLPGDALHILWLGALVSESRSVHLRLLSFPFLSTKFMMPSVMAFTGQMCCGPDLWSTFMQLFPPRVVTRLMHVSVGTRPVSIRQWSLDRCSWCLALVVLILRWVVTTVVTLVGVPVVPVWLVLCTVLGLPLPAETVPGLVMMPIAALANVSIELLCLATVLCAVGMLCVIATPLVVLVVTVLVSSIRIRTVCVFMTENRTVMVNTNIWMWNVDDVSGMCWAWCVAWSMG